MSILVDKDTRLLVQGFTGSQATLHSEQSVSYTHLTLPTKRIV